MKTKYTLTLILLLLFTFAQSATIVVTNTNDSGAGSLRDAFSNANSEDTIRFSPSLISSGNAVITLTTRIFSSDKSIVIKGLYNSSDTLYIKNQSNNSLMYFDVSGMGITSKIVFDSLVIMNSVASPSLIFTSHDSVIVTNCIFRNNVMASYFSSILEFNHTGNSINGLFIKMMNCNFEENSNIDTYGSCVKANPTFSTGPYVDDCEAEIINCSFKNNNCIGFISTAQNGSYLHNINVLNSSFFGNVSGIYTNGAEVNLDVKKCIFKGNSNPKNGGAILCSSFSKANLKISNSSFCNNLSQLNGGAISIEPSATLTGFTPFGNKLTIENCEFNNNISRRKGGVIYANNITITTNLNGTTLDVNLTKSKFNNNGSDDNGSVLFSESYLKNTLNIDDCYFANNKDLLSSSRNYMLCAKSKNDSLLANFDKVTFDNNDSIFNDALIGLEAGTIGSANVNNSLFNRNSSGISLLFRKKSFLNIENCIFSNNNLTSNLIESQICDSSFITSKNNTFYNNIGQYSRLVSCVASYVAECNIENNTFYNNRTGNALYTSAFSSNANGRSETNILKSTFYNNKVWGNPNPLSNWGIIDISYRTNDTAILTIGNSILFSEDSLFYCRSNYKFTSLLNNIFSDTLIKGRDILLDYLITDSSILGLDTLAFKGGSTPVCAPKVGSFAINKGNPTDLSFAQNSRIQDTRRDIGAAERSCVFYSSDTIYECGFGITDCSGNARPLITYSQDTLLNSGNACDTFINRITLTEKINTTVTQLNGELRSNDLTTAYQWLDCSNGFSVIAGAINSNFIPLINGTYALELTKGSCIDTTACYSINNVGLGDGAENLNFNIYPNPTQNELFLEIESAGKNGIVTVFDLKGKIILKTAINNRATISLDVSKLPSGIYIVNLVTDNGFYSKKLIKQE